MSERGGRPPGPRLAIVGPTATGKSALALAVADRLAARGRGAEVLSADSMAVYRGMDVGTTTPTPQERARVRHHLIDLVEPHEEHSVAELQAAARRVVAEVEGRGAVPVLVGGTGLYVQAVVDDLQLPGRYPDVAAELEAEADTVALHARLAELDPPAAARIEPTNRRRVVRALEVTLGSGRPFSSFGPGVGAHPPTPWCLVGLRLPRAELARRIEARVEAQLAAGWLDEVAALVARPEGLSRTAAHALGYRELADHLAGRCSLEEAVAATVARTRRFAARQERWFRRDPRVRWWDVPEAGSAQLAEAVVDHLDATAPPTGGSSGRATA